MCHIEYNVCGDRKVACHTLLIDHIAQRVTLDEVASVLSLVARHPNAQDLTALLLIFSMDNPDTRISHLILRSGLDVNYRLVYNSYNVDLNLQFNWLQGQFLTILLKAVMSNRVDVVAFLLDHGHVKREDLNEVLVFGIMHSSVAMVKFLSGQAQRFWCVLVTAVERGDPAVLRSVLESYPGPSEYVEYVWDVSTACENVVERNLLPLIKVFTEFGVDPFYVQKSGSLNHGAFNRVKQL
jgi:hypothetical protein